MASSEPPGPGGDDRGKKRGAVITGIDFRTRGPVGASASERRFKGTSHRRDDDASAAETPGVRPPPRPEAADAADWLPDDAKSIYVALAARQVALAEEGRNWISIHDEDVLMGYAEGEAEYRRVCQAIKLVNETVRRQRRERLEEQVPPDQVDASLAAFTPDIDTDGESQRRLVPLQREKNRMRRDLDAAARELGFSPMTGARLRFTDLVGGAPGETGDDDELFAT